MDDPLLTRWETAAFLGITLAGLDALLHRARHDSTVHAPTAIKISRNIVRFRKSDVLAFVAECEQRFPGKVEA